MCRLFGMSGGSEPVAATFWLLGAPDSIESQSHREPDGSGLGVFRSDAQPHRHRSARPAFRDPEFAREARRLESRTFIAHIRFASTGAAELRNTHPFEQRGRLFAHNGVLEDLERLDAELGDAARLVHGDTDSERFFALVTREVGRAGGDVAAGLTTAARWAAEHLALFALNVVLTTPEGLWALRYPDTHRLLVLERRAGGHRGDRAFHGRSAGDRLHVHCYELAGRPAVVVASEPLDDDPGWRDLEPGELLHVGPDLAVTSTIVIEDLPRHLLTLDDLHPAAAASQAPELARSPDGDAPTTRRHPSARNRGEQVLGDLCRRWWAARDADVNGQQLVQRAGQLAARAEHVAADGAIAKAATSRGSGIAS